MTPPAAVTRKLCRSCGRFFYLDLTFDECWLCRDDLFPDAAEEPEKPEALFNREYPVPWDELFPLIDPADNWTPAVYKPISLSDSNSRPNSLRP